MNMPKPGALWQVWALAAATLACLLPFLTKAVHMDDPLFIWTARHIQKDPLNFYGFTVNWYTAPAPMAEVMQNPPLTAYYMAFVASCLGWSETALHFGFLWPAVAAILGVYFLGREFCGHPFLAALATLATPAFLVSSTSLMCDIMMLAFWVWAVFFWMRGLAQSSHPQLALAVLLAAACGLTKYFGFCLLPLLAVYSVMTQRKMGWWVAYLCLPLVVLLGYHALAYHLYGKNLLFNAIGYATRLRVGGGLSSKIPTGLCFTGGCIFIATAALPLLWAKRGVIVASVGVIALLALLAVKKSIAGFSLVEDAQLNWFYLAQWSLFVVGGTSFIVLTITDAGRNKDAKSVLLLLWVFGTFIFTIACNWTVAARNILPMVPAAALLLVRGVERRPSAGPASPLRLFWISLAVSLAVALTVADADFKLAESARTAAQTIYEKTVWTFKAITFEGHWGFQYYMEQLDAKPTDKFHPQFAPDVAIVIPMANSNISIPSQARAEFWNEFDISSTIWMAVMSVNNGAGFYSDGWGPIPFVFCRPPIERYQIYRGK
jgi:4-amino-4-deoxy-L-arabinose transferase-like glycosyltransferase